MTKLRKNVASVDEAALKAIWELLSSMSSAGMSSERYVRKKQVDMELTSYPFPPLSARCCAPHNDEYHALCAFFC
jgi:hypothetical protein